MKKPSYNNRHLTIDERKIIQTGIENRSSKADIARVINKDPSTVAKEVRKHRIFKPRNTYQRPIICIHIRECGKACRGKCTRYEEPGCRMRDISPGACNKCASSTGCHLDKYIYDAEHADKEYRRDLADFREGINLTTKERDRIGSIIAPLLKKGQSVYQIMAAHKDEIGISERTVYHYIETGVFKSSGIDSFSLKEQVNRKQFRGKYKPRREQTDYSGRRYSDFLRFISDNPDIPVVEMDTVMNSPHGPYIQTFQFNQTKAMIGFLHHEKTSGSMASTLDMLQEKLGSDLFCRLFPVILTDRGSEFEKYGMFESGPDGITRCRLFYCDPMQSSQKPHVENNHNYVRDIIPNGYPLGRITQEDLDVMFSHINSTARKSMADRTPYEMFVFLYGKETAGILDINPIEKDKVTLKPCLLNHVYKRTNLL
jgi:IS30 family transposase